MSCAHWVKNLIFILLKIFLNFTVDLPMIVNSSGSGIVDSYSTSTASQSHLTSLKIKDKMSRNTRKTVFGRSDLIRHIPACTVTEEGKKLEISDLGRRGMVLSM